MSILRRFHVSVFTPLWCKDTDVKCSWNVRKIYTVYYVRTRIRRGQLCRVKKLRFLITYVNFMWLSRTFHVSVFTPLGGLYYLENSLPGSPVPKSLLLARFPVPVPVPDLYYVHAEIANQKKYKQTPYLETSTLSWNKQPIAANFSHPPILFFLLKIHRSLWIWPPGHSGQA